MTIRNCTAAFILLLVLGMTANGIADDTVTPMVVGQKVILHSQALNQDRPVFIGLPAGYEQSASRYPVLFVLDGEMHFFHTTGITRFLSGSGAMPKMIVVGIPNIDRGRDLGPAIRQTDDPAVYTAIGDSAKFLQFLQDELIPYVDGHYRTHPYRVLTGHCLAGLFTVHTFLALPETFQAHLAITPYMPDLEVVFPEYYVEPFLSKHPSLKGFLFIASGKEKESWVSGIRSLARVFADRAPAGLETQYQHFPEAGHGMEVHLALYEALQALYRDWRMPTGPDRKLNLQMVENHYAMLSEKFSYPVPVPEEILIKLGYAFLQHKMIEEAIEVFQKNVQVYPESWNAYDSLGEAFMVCGKKEQAMLYYKKSLTLNPDNENGRRHLEKLRAE